MRTTFLLMVSACALMATAQIAPVATVEKFGSEMQQWCASDDVSHHAALLKMTKGQIMCRVDDQITQNAAETDTAQLLPKGTQVIESYLGIFQNAITDGMTFELTNAQHRPDIIVPTLDSKEEIPSFVTASMKCNGAMVYDITDLFFVRDGKITKIVDYSGDNSLGRALELYSKKDYDAAFRMFRRLAYADFTNVDAQYYLALMEIKGQGCKFLDKKVRDMELMWFVCKNVLAKDPQSTSLAMRFKMDDSKIGYSHYPSVYEWILRCKQPMNSGRMVSFDARTMTCGFVDEKGKLVVPYGKYSIAYPFCNGRSMVVSKQTGKCGYIDPDGNEVVPLIYDVAMTDYYKGRTYCLRSGRAFLVDMQGMVIKEFEGYKLLWYYLPSGRYVALGRGDNDFDVYDYSGKLIDTGYSENEFNSITGIVSIKGQGKEVRYRAVW